MLPPEYSKTPGWHWLAAGALLAGLILGALWYSLERVV